ncbi:exosortase A [Pseudoduganella violaceinigra]|uniref:exosortase A n=1 Tax=Pseudoduganella violaceinigra TaxID=246602 RepID=UPI000424E01E|nr:exosortase A [Pseudoduganella violaceinigra]
MNTLPSSGPDAAPGSAGAPAPADGARNALLVALVMLLPLLVFHETALTLAQIWERSETFAHGFLILPISLYLVWRQRGALAALPLRPYWPAMPLLAACGAAWLLADLVEVGIVRQYALALMLPLSVLAVLGKRVAGALLFPLAFVLFAVPVGESLIPPLIELTANFTVDALRLTGIPVLRDGNSFSIPTGNWSVVEACSGLRYLISSITLGCLFAYLSYRTVWRRAAFVLASVLVPLAANGVRAYMIVMMGHLSGMKLAVGVDHLIYGWIFFGLVMLLLFWIGSFWREDLQAAPAPAAVPAPAPQLPARPLLGAAGGVLAMLLAWPLLAARADQAAAAAAPPVRLAFAPATPAGPEFSRWEPDFAPASATLRQSFGGAPPVGLTVLYYRDAAGGAKLVSSTNQLGHAKTEFRENSAALRDERFAGRTVAVREAMLGVEGRRLLVWQWYWINGSMTSSDYVGKLLQAKSKLLTGSSDGAAVMVFAPYDEDPAAARGAMRAFLDSNLAPLERSLAANRRP